MPFLLQRKWTLPEKKQNDEKPKNVSWNVEGKQISFWSIPECEKQNDEEFIQSKKTINNKITKPIDFATQHSIEQTQLLPKIEQANSLTVSYLDSHQNNILPNIKTLSKAKKLLASGSQFSLHQKNHLVDGKYHSQLEDLQKKQQAYLHRLSISSKVKIKTRQNVFEVQKNKQRKSQSCFSSSSNTHQVPCSVKLIQQSSRKKQVKNINSIRETLRDNIKLRSRSYDRWKLKDFYDPLLEACMTDKTKFKALKQREHYVKNIKKIEEKCSIIEAESQVNKYLEIFGRYNQAIDSKLVKKQRKLDKIKEVFRKT